MPRGPRALRPVENRPIAHGARVRWWTWHGRLHDQRTTRSTLRRWPRLICADTAPGWLLRLRNLVATAFESRATRPPLAPRAVRPVENHPTAHGANARWRTWRGCLLGQRATRSTSRRSPNHLCADTAPGRRHWDVKLVTTSFKPRNARPARASPHGEPADCPRSSRALADLTWLSLRPTRAALRPTPLAEALPHRHRARLAAVGLKCRDPSV